ncbi:MAG: protein-disulfide reductase DsbD [Sulfurimonadaceae bacterium]|jgi:thiol:disulfide interchange protein DsbD|nr:protein-disulfide reductase DsbD [Sulfurimonadaceae bacterium]
MRKIILLFASVMLLWGALPKFLMPEEAFIPHAKIDSAMGIEVEIELTKDIYLYEDKVIFTLKESDGITIANVKKPTSVLHHDEMVYLTSPTFYVTLEKDAQTSGVQKIAFEVAYQGCSEQGLCYEPLTQIYDFDIDTAKLDRVSATKVDKQETTSEAVADEALSEVDSIAASLASQSIFWSLLTLFGIGILISLTPCVFPMIPIISGVIVSQGEGLTTKRAFFLSLVYVLAMAVAYTIAGILAGLFGANIQAALQNPYAIYAFATIFVALALSMFGYYELKLPASLVSRVSGSTSKSGVAGVAIMGFLSALIVGPCVAAPLAGVLVYIGQTGDAIFGGMALFSLSMGMGVPLIVVGVGAGKFMPKPGAWMTMVTAIFGVMMLGVAIWMLERIVDPYITMMLWAILGVGFALFLGAFETTAHVFRRTLGLVVFIYAIILFIGVLGGSKSMMQPLDFLQSQQVVQTTTQKTKLEFTTITSIAELDTLLEKNKGKKILLDFSAEWCAICKQLDAETFSHADVIAKMQEFVLIKADVTKNTAEEKALTKKYGVFGPPAILIFDKTGTLVKSKSIIGFIDAESFVNHLNQI